MDQMLQQTLLSTASQLEKTLDDQLNHLDSMGTDDLQALRDQRLKEMKKQSEQRQQWLAEVKLTMSKQNRVTQLV